VRLSQIVFSQGFGARRACEGLVAGGFVAIDGVVGFQDAAKFSGSLAAAGL